MFYRYNTRYGRHSAEDGEVEDAAKAADIHNRIVALPDGIAHILVTFHYTPFSLKIEILIETKSEH